MKKLDIEAFKMPPVFSIPTLLCVFAIFILYQVGIAFNIESGYLIMIAIVITALTLIYDFRSFEKHYKFNKEIYYLNLARVNYTKEDIEKKINDQNTDNKTASILKNYINSKR